MIPMGHSMRRWERSLVMPLRRVPPRHGQGLAASGAVASAAPPALTDWLQSEGAPGQKLQLQRTTLGGREIDVTVAREPLAEGDLALQIPDRLVVTLDRIFENETVAELLTTDKLSELACLALYLMYERKRGEESYWYAYIQELNRLRARGVLAAESPLLWSDVERESYLEGSPVLKLVQERLESIRSEYKALDTVWFMSGSLFNQYPYDVPTEAFSFEMFKQAFAVVQSSVVHLQGVPLARRFALVPLGPPCLTYSSTARATFVHDLPSEEVRLVVDRAYSPGDPVVAWCGPQPNSRLLLNYGIVDEENPYDKVPLVATLPNSGPLYQIKRRFLESAGLATKQTFQLQRGKGIPKQLIPFMRVCYCGNEADLKELDMSGVAGVSDEDTVLVQHLVLFLQQRLGRYKRTLEVDMALLQDEKTPVRQRVACRLLICEKRVLHDALAELMNVGCAPQTSDVTGHDTALLERLSQQVIAAASVLGSLFWKSGDVL